MNTKVNPLEELLGVTLPTEGNEITLLGTTYRMKGRILRQAQLVAPVQEDIANFYDVHWKQPGGYDSPESDHFQLELFRVMFPGFEQRVPREVGDNATVLDVGCGSGVAGRAYFRGLFDRIKYVGVDMSSAIEQARDDFEKLKQNVGLLQAELTSLPFAEKTFDFVFCPGVLHYTNDMRVAIGSLARILKRGGHFVTWIYKKQKPLRHLTDDYIRSVISAMSPQDAFEAVKPLTKLGIALGQITQELDVPEDIPFLGIEKGKYNLQRFFYYHIMKLFYNPDLPFTRHVINNWNAYYPKQVLFLPPEEIRSFFEDANCEISLWSDQGNGLGIVAIKR